MTTVIVLLLALTAAHATGLHFSKWTQNVLVGIKLLLIVAFVAVGLTISSNEWPTWTPPNAGLGFPSAR